MLNVEKTTLEGVFLVKPSAHEDARGNFYETYNEREYQEADMTAKFVQDDVSVSKKGVLKGMHGDSWTYKLVQCVKGSVYAVILNCDEASPTSASGSPLSCQTRISISSISRHVRKRLLCPDGYGGVHL